MTQLNITLDTDKLKEVILSSNLNEMMKVCLVAILNAYMEAERDAFIQASSYERKVSRRDYRNGSYEREYITNIGSVRLKVPRTRSGEFDTEVFERYQRFATLFSLTNILNLVVKHYIHIAPLFPSQTKKWNFIFQEVILMSLHNNMDLTTPKKINYTHIKRVL